MVLVLLPCTFPNFTPKSFLLFLGCMAVTFIIRVLWLLLPTGVSMKSPVTTGSDGLPLSCMSGTYLGSGLQKFGSAITSDG